MAYVEDHTRLFFAEVVTSWLLDVLPNIVAEMFERLDYATHFEVDAQVDHEMTVWELRIVKSLMQEA